MSTRTTSAVIAALSLSIGAVAAQEAKSGLELGKHEYQSKCAVCHGMSGRGEGPRAESLARMPPDLTTYARRAGGGFPVQHAAAVIDGRAYYDRPRLMPVWGQYYTIEAPDAARSAQYTDLRIMALADYVATLQAQ